LCFIVESIRGVVKRLQQCAQRLKGLWEATSFKIRQAKETVGRKRWGGWKTQGDQA